MSMLARYRKAGGVMELVKLIEDSAEPKRTSLLEMVRKEDADFAKQVEARFMKFENVKNLPEAIQAEIYAMTPAKFVAISLTGESPEYIKFVEKCLGKNFNEYKQEKENLLSAPPAQGQVEAARRKLISELRKLEASGNIRIPYGDSPLPSTPVGSATSVGAPVPGTPGESPSTSTAGVTLPPPGNAKASDPCPSVDTFKMEAPPPGLSGERLETYLKGVFGR